ncbi:MAG: hypothetical protein V1772_06795, partial [Chloroflexota bacterium]
MAARMAQRVQSNVAPTRSPHWLGRMLELLAILGWALFVGRPYLNLDPMVWPEGREFGMVLQSHFAWRYLLQCGDCVFWNGFANGGAPTFGEIHGAVAHPFVILTTLLWGAVNSAKLTIVFGLAVGGLAQWWLARALGLGRLARVWSAAMAVAGGHLAGRMDAGLVPLVLSTASVSLVYPALVQLSRRGRGQDVVLLAATAALALVSGQGYLQLGLLFALVPSAVVLLFAERLRLRPEWPRFVWAALLALLLSAYFLVPMLHFWPYTGKHLDASFKSAQRLAYLPLNLVIKDEAYFRMEVLGKQVFPFIYVNYIGWFPVLLAALGIRMAPKGEGRPLLFLVVSTLMVYLAASSLTFRALKPLLPTLAMGVRLPSLIAGLAVAPILGLAAWGVDGLARVQWPRISIVSGSSQEVARARWLSLG